MPRWIFVLIIILSGIGIALGVVYYVDVYMIPGGRMLQQYQASPLQVELIPPQVAAQKPQLLTLDDIRITSIRIGNDVTVLLDWHANETGTPFHFEVRAEGGDLLLSAPNTKLRRIQIVSEGMLTLFGSTLYRETDGNRLAIDGQVE